MLYEQPLELEQALRVVRVRMWEKGHTFQEIDDMSIEDMGDVLGYWSEYSRAEEKIRERGKRMRH